MMRTPSCLVASLLIALSGATSAFMPPMSLPTSIPSSLASKYTRTPSELFVSTPTQDSDSSLQASSAQLQPESASVLPGQVLTIRIGDTSNPRKAWKKRRRSGSPILVPCTILGMNRETMVKWNLMNLLHRFGKPQEHNGVVLSVGAAVKLYKHRLGGSLLEHANGLGHRTIVELLRSLFDDNALRETGVQVSRSGPKNELFLTSSLSLRLARESAYKAEFVQFQPSGDDAERMVHTGTTFQLPQKDKYQTFSMPDIVQPLSAAVRISQADAESGRFQTGMECNAFVHTYDAKGDNGSPLLTCAIDPPRGQIRNQMKRRAYVKRQIDAKQTRKTNDEVIGSGGAERDLNELKVGDGPYTAAVVRVSTRAGAAFVDLGVHRQMGKKSGGGTAKVLAMLRFDDIVDNMSSEDTDPEAALIEASLLEGSDEEELFTVEDLFMDEEEEVDEDVTDMYSIDEDGTVSAVDTSTGETKIIGSANSEDDDDDDDSEEEDDDNMFAGMSPEERLRAIGEMLEAEEPAKRVESKKTAAAKVDSRLKQGDKIDVYVRAVFPQSGRFMVTLNPAIKGRKMKDMKREKEAEKRLERLTSKMGGGDGLQDILSSIGLIMEGSVKAKSNTGDWYYVQPDVEGFPVGIAKSDVQGALTPGQKAKIRIDGIDETRGQLALTILESLD